MITEKTEFVLLRVKHCGPIPILNRRGPIPHPIKVKASVANSLKTMGIDVVITPLKPKVKIVEVPNGVSGPEIINEIETPEEDSIVLPTEEETSALDNIDVEAAIAEEIEEEEVIEEAVAEEDTVEVIEEAVAEEEEVIEEEVKPKKKKKKK